MSAVAFLSTLQTLDAAALRSRVQGRSYWRLRMTDGRIVNEWEVDWSLAPARGRQALRLYCPNGKVAELGSSEDATGRLFQFKCAIVTAGAGHGTTAQVIGIVDDNEGNCQCAAWDYARERLVTFRDNVHAFQFEHVGALNPDVLGIRPD